MGTRSITYVKDDDKESLAAIYRQFDGYPGGHGMELVNALKTSELINGFCMDQKAPRFFNGMGCLAAWLVGHLKKDIGGIYLQPANSTIGCGIEYIYTVYPRDNVIYIKAQRYDNEYTIFDLPVKECEAAIRESRY